MADRTRVAVLGAGFIADIHLESLHRFVPEAEVTAIYSRSAARAEAMARKYGIPRWFDDVDRRCSRTRMRSTWSTSACRIISTPG